MAEPAEHVQPGDTGHGEIKDNQVGPLAVDAVESLGAVSGTADCESLRFKLPRQHGADALVVVDEEYATLGETSHSVAILYRYEMQSRYL